MSPKANAVALIGHNNPPPQKAGFVISGYDADEKLCMLMPYSQGRFSADPTDSRKYYVPAKGSLDEGETNPILAAVRETFEETGIDVKRLLGEDNFKKFASGEAVGKFESPGYAGVTVSLADPKQHKEYGYLSVAGKKWRADVYAIELEHIEKLQPYLKRLPNPEQPARATDIQSPQETLREARPHEPEVIGGTIAQYVRAQGYPTFNQLLAILRTGKVEKKKGSKWATEDCTLFDTPSLDEFASAHGKTIRSVDDLANLYRNVLTGPEFKVIRAQLGSIKEYLKEKNLVGDNFSVKMDDKDLPLSFYHEAAEILPVEIAITRSLKAALSNPTYAHAIWGTIEPKQVQQSAENYFKNAQIRGVAIGLGFRSMESTKAACVGITAAAHRLREQLGASPSDVSRNLVNGGHAFVHRIKKLNRELGGEQAASI